MKIRSIVAKLTCDSLIMLAEWQYSCCLLVIPWVDTHQVVARTCHHDDCEDGSCFESHVTAKGHDADNACLCGGTDLDEPRVLVLRDSKPRVATRIIIASPEVTGEKRL